MNRVDEREWNKRSLLIQRGNILWSPSLILTHENPEFELRSFRLVKGTLPSEL